MVDCLADEVFEHQRLVAIYDVLDPDRSDLDVYVGIADQLGARRMLDVGCGTGTFTTLLADRGLEVTGVEPAGGSLDVAQVKAGRQSCVLDTRLRDNPAPDAGRPCHHDG